MKKRILIYILLLSAGALLLLLGLFAERPVLSGILTGVGTIVLGFSAAKAVPLLMEKKAGVKNDKIEWEDERNTAIREKASWYAGLILIAAMSVSSLILALTQRILGACVIAGLLLLYSFSIMILSAYFNRKL